MADFTDRIRLTYDVVTSGAQSSLDNLKTRVSDAEGAAGKTKAALGGLADMAATALPAAIGAAGVALGKFALDGAGDFAKLADSAANFSAATGLAVQDAGRWIEVSGDLGVSTDAVQGAMGRLNKEAATGQLQQYGIDGKDAGERLVNLVTKLNETEDGAARAKLGAETLGKSWQSLAPLIEHAGELRDRLQDVADVKVIDPSDVQRAHDYDDAMDNLHDSVEELQLSIGRELVPALAAGADGLANMAKGAGILDSELDKATDKDSFWSQVLHNLTRDLGYVTGGTQQHDDALRKRNDAMVAANQASQAQSDQLAINNALLTDATANTDGLQRALQGMGLDAGSASDAVDDLNASVEDLAGKFLDSAGNALRAQTQQAQLFAALQSGKTDVLAIEAQFLSYAKTLESQGGNPAAIEGLNRLKGLVQPGSPLDVYLTNLINGLDTIGNTDAHATVAVDGAAQTQQDLDYIKTVLQQIDGYDAEARLTYTINYEGPSIPAGFGGAPTPPGLGRAATPAVAAAGYGAVGVASATTAPPMGIAAMPMAVAAPTILNVNIGGGNFLGTQAEVGRWVAGALDAYYRTNGMRRRP